MGLWTHRRSIRNHLSVGDAMETRRGQRAFVLYAMHMNRTFFLMAGFAMLITVLTVLGVGLSIWTGRRKRPGACACDFDPDKARAKAERGGECCGGGGHAAKPETSAEPACKDGCCGGSACG